MLSPLFFMLYLFSYRLYAIVFNWVLVLNFIVYLLLLQFFHTSDLLLDKTIFFFSLNELLIIIGGESGGVFNVYLWFYLLVLVGVITSLLYYRKIINNRVLRITGQFFTLVFICLFVFRMDIYPKNLIQYSHYETQVHASKQTFFFSSIINSFKSSTNKVLSPIELTKGFRHELGDVANYSRIVYPMLRNSSSFNTNNWTEYIDLSESPNVVFIIAEGLSSQFLGDHSVYPGLTPFLDSLSKQSLYWPNMLSITDRTHGVFAAAFAGLPHAFERGFLNYTGETPNYISIMKLLDHNDYSFNFFYGGWSDFDGYKNFLVQNSFDSIVDEAYIRENLYLTRDTTLKDFSWGIHDHSMVDAYFKYLDKKNPPSPYFNLFLTLSLHSPFDIPYKNLYINAIEKKTTQSLAKKFESQKDLYASVLYSDQALKKFFSIYEKREDFHETVFIIVGDHSVLSVDLNNALGMYHVPFIIYSPSIHKPKTFEEVISHWDIAPTLYDLLPGLKETSKMEMTSWLGNGVRLTNNMNIDTPIFLGTFRGDINGVLKDKWVLLNNRLYTFDKNLKLAQAQDAQKEEEYMQLIELYKQVNEYAMEKNKILPFEE